MTMPEPVQDTSDSISPDLSHFVTEDDRPVDNRFSERQQRMLPHILFTSWQEGKPFEALSDVGLFYNSQESYPVVPDFMLSLGVEPRPLTGEKENRSYFIWLYGKAPDLVIEVVSNREGGEDTTKFEKYRQIRITYYAIFDPFHRLSNRRLRLYRLVEGNYVEMASPAWMPEIGLGLTLWTGTFEDSRAEWLRFINKDGELLATGEEMSRTAVVDAEAAKADAEAAKADAEAAKADAEAAKADAEAAKAKGEQAEVAAREARARAERLARKLRELGIEEDEAF
jgi:Uma2 family endonuclease